MMGMGVVAMPPVPSPILAPLQPAGLPGTTHDSPPSQDTNNPALQSFVTFRAPEKSEPPKATVASPKEIALSRRARLTAKAEGQPTPDRVAAGTQIVHEGDRPRRSLLAMFFISATLAAAVAGIVTWLFFR